MSFSERRLTVRGVTTLVAALAVAGAYGAPVLEDLVYIDQEQYNETAKKEIAARDAVFAKQDESLKKAKALAKEKRFAECAAIYGSVQKELAEMAQKVDSTIIRKRLQTVSDELASLRAVWGGEVLKKAREAQANKRYNEAMAIASQLIHIDERFAADARKIIDDANASLKAAEFRNATDINTIEPNFAERKESVARLLREAKTFYDNSKFLDARDRIEQVYLLDPTNMDAMEMMQMIYAKLYTYGIRRHKTEMTGLMANSQWSWVEPVFLVSGEGNVKSGIRVDAGTDAIMEHMDRIIFPTVTFKDMPITNLIKFLNDRNKDYDPEKKGIDIAFKSGSSDKIPTVTIDLSYMPLSDIIRYVCDGSGMKYRVEPDGVLIGPDVDPMQIRHFPVRKNLIDSISGDSGAPVVADDFGGDPMMGGDLGMGMGAGMGAGMAADTGMGDGMGMGDGLGGGGMGGGMGGEEGGLGTIGEGADTKEFFANVGGAKVNKIDSRMLQNYFTRRGIEFKNGSSVLYERNLERLTVRNTVENLRKIDELIRQLDAINTPLVLVEIRCIEVAENDFQELGFDWSINSRQSRLGGNDSGNRKWELNQIDEGSMNQMIRPLESVIANVSHGTLINQLDIFPALFGTSYPFGKDFNFNLSLTVNAICQNSRTETLSAPKLLTESGNATPARIELIKQYYFPDEWEEYELDADDGGLTITPPRPSFEDPTDVGIIFDVSARVSPDEQGTINLKLDPQIIQYVSNDTYDINIYGREIDAQGNENERNFHYSVWMPVFSERVLSVNVKVYDGCTLVLGGIVQNQMSSRVDKWPFFGDLPLIGRFFQSRAEVGKRTNMMMFVTARLVGTDGIPLKQYPEQGIPDFLR